MKKYTLFAVFSFFAFIALTFNVGSVNAQSVFGCTAAGPYNTANGELCAPMGCMPGFLFSTINGQSCAMGSTYPLGCSSTVGYSSINGRPCSGSQFGSLPATISSVGPTMIFEGSTVHVYGSNFGSNSFIYFDHNLNNFFEIIEHKMESTTHLSFTLPPNTSIGNHTLFVAQSGFGDIAPRSNSVIFSVLPDTTSVSCSATLLGNSTIVAWHNISWAVNSTPVGLKAYLYGTKNGTVDYNGKAYVGTTDLVQIYNFYPWEAGTYNRYYVLKDSSENVVCTTNTITIKVNPY